MIEFTIEELELIERLSNLRGKDGGEFTFKRLSENLGHLKHGAKDDQAYAKDLGQRIKGSVEDPKDDRLSFRITQRYDEKKVRLADGGSISYTLL